MYRKIPGLLILIFISTFSFGQFYKSFLPSPEFSAALEKIVLDFREDYKNIQGDQIDKQGESETYISTVSLPGIKDCKILRFHSVEDTTASWQGVVYSGDNFKEAVRAYENTYRLVKKSTIRWIDRTLIGFTGDLNAPRDDVRFTTTILQLKSTDKRYKNFQAEIELLSNYNGYEVQFHLSKKHQVQ